MVKVGIKVSPVSTIWIGTILWDPFSGFSDEGLESMRGIMSSGGAENSQALKFVFASNSSDLRSELTFQLDFKSRFLHNEIFSVHQVYKITFQFQLSKTKI